MTRVKELLYFLVFSISTLIVKGNGKAAAEIPPNFPNDIEIQLGTYKNWAHETVVDNILITSPSNADQLITIANWAVVNGYKLRPKGAMHGWSPLTVTETDSQRNLTVLIDTTKYLTSMELNINDNIVTAETGVTLDALLEYLEAHGKGLIHTPATGSVTLGGMIAISAHGAGISNLNEPGATGFGSISNLLWSITLVAWNQQSAAFELKSLQRTNSNVTALLTNIGRTLITSVQLNVEPNYNLRCQSTTEISADELFARSTAPNARTFESFLSTSGRVATIQFPFTTYPWVKFWTRADTQPTGSRLVTSPYNYPFTDNIPVEFSDLLVNIVTGLPQLTPVVSKAIHAQTATGVFIASDLWGPSKNTLLYLKETTIRYHTFGFVIITSKGNVQRILSEFVPFYNQQLADYAANDKYPINGPIEIRVVGVDHAWNLKSSSTSSLTSLADPPDLSPVLETNANPEFDVAIQIDVNTFPKTPHASEFFEMLENHIYGKYNIAGGNSIVRPEWSKGWGYTMAGGAWSNRQFITEQIPAIFSTLNHAKSIFRYYDQHEIFTNDLLKLILD